jgi:hypothetical protein
MSEGVRAWIGSARYAPCQQFCQHSQRCAGTSATGPEHGDLLSRPATTPLPGDAGTSTRRSMPPTTGPGRKRLTPAEPSSSQPSNRGRTQPGPARAGALVSSTWLRRGRRHTVRQLPLPHLADDRDQVRRQRERAPMLPGVVRGTSWSGSWPENAPPIDHLPFEERLLSGGLSQVFVSR